MKQFLQKLVFDGKIPYENILKKILIFLSILVLILAPILTSELKEFGEMGLNLLVFILLIRPLSQVFPEFKIFRKLVSMRREFGILCACLVLAHSISYFVKTEQFPHEMFLAENFWRLENFFVWGFLGLILALILLITSNNVACRILKSWWKPVQLLSYLFLIFGSIHVFLHKGGSFFNFIESFALVFVIAIFWIFARKKYKFYILPQIQKILKK